MLRTRSETVINLGMHRSSSEEHGWALFEAVIACRGDLLNQPGT